jgi:poly-gamma-glutamate synthesis protein (capsule biosynthesis protein)
MRKRRIGLTVAGLALAGLVAAVLLADPARMGQWWGYTNDRSRTEDPAARHPVPPGASPSGGPEGAPSSPAAPPAPVVREAVLYAVGDIMVHMPQLPAYLDAATGIYDFSPWFEDVTPIFAEGDWVVGNLETTLAGADLKYSGFPRFNSPPELAADLREAGFHLLSTANNHSLDRGWSGIVRTLDNLRRAGLTPVGTAADPEEARRPVIVERNGIRLGFLAYTYGTNGIPMPKDKPFAVNLIDTDRIRGDIARTRQAGADAVAVFLHFGTEYQKWPNDDQRAVARAAVEAGAHLVIGSHPHVVQPYEFWEAPAPSPGAGGDAGHRGLIFYSLGNFISNQTGDGTDNGLIAGVRITRTEMPDGVVTVTVSSPELIPTWVHIRKQNGKRHYRILPLPRILADEERTAYTPDEYRRMERMLAELDAHVRAFEPDDSPARRS